MTFERNYEPHEFIEGSPSSRIWIIGFNPAAEQDWKDSERTSKELENFFSDEAMPSYFKDFERVSPKLFKLLGQKNGVAHTDLVKCSSKEWPPKTCKGAKSRNIINNCRENLIQQILTYKPSMIICNGAAISKEIEKIIPPTEQQETYYKSIVDDVTVTVVQSGFIGRIDNFSRRRLGIEIETLLEEIERN